MKDVYYLTDSYQINPAYGNLVQKYQLEKYCVSINGVWQPDFVGFVFAEDALILSFPKHYYKQQQDLTNADIQLLAKLMTKTRYISGLDDQVGPYENFPLRAYLNVCSYYAQHGLYNKTVKTKENNFQGKIDWRSTIRKSNKIISNGNLVFLPFIVEKNEVLHVFITECMIYVLSDGFARLGKYFQVGVNFTKQVNNPIFRNMELVIKQLHMLKASHFKDSERLLIQSLIDYFTWSSNSGEKTILATKNFESYWELMVENYLNKNLHDVDSGSNLVFKQGCNKFKLKKQVEKIESDRVRLKEHSKRFNVEYDHLYVSRDNIAYLFDSKYYKDVTGLDYKQMAYQFILRSSRALPNERIVNGLILPTETDYCKKVHLDTRDQEGPLNGLLINEYYINTKEVIEAFVNK